ncbi:MAG: glycosyltransferase [Coriobacteriales bacterium]|jgi:GT2 family glycosyltransferase
MDISIIAAFDNSMPLQANFFDGIFAVTDLSDWELVMASDKCMNTDTLELTRKMADEHENVKLVECPKKVGYSKANNAGVAASTGEYLLFINTDVFPEPGAIETLRAAFDANPNLGAVQGLLLYPQNEKVMCTGHTFNDYMNHHLYNGRKATDAPVQVAGPRQALNSAFLMMPRKVFDEMGGFTEFYYNAYDGMELTLRVGQAGYDLLYLPEAIGWHSTGGSRDYIRHNNEYQSKYFYRWFGESIRTDLPDYLAPQLAEMEVADEYFVVNCTFSMTVDDLLAQLGLKSCGYLEIESRDSSHIDLYRNVVPEVLNMDKPILFVVNHFGDISSNNRWFSKRPRKDDLIIDFFGNAMKVVDR